MVRLLIADDHQVLIDGFKSIFDYEEGIHVVATALNGQEVLDHLKDIEVDVILLDINMPVLNGVETTKRITKKYPAVKVIALSMYDQQSYFKRMMQYGARGYLLKNDPIDEILIAISTVMQGQRYISEKLRDQLSSIEFLTGSKQDVEISTRELDVLKLISEGMTDTEMAEKLFISSHTVNSHRKNLLSKFNAKNSAVLVKKALEKGLI